jgi:hypothetical protein
MWGPTGGWIAPTCPQPSVSSFLKTYTPEGKYCTAWLEVRDLQVSQFSAFPKRAMKLDADSYFWTLGHVSVLFMYTFCWSLQISDNALARTLPTALRNCSNDHEITKLLQTTTFFTVATKISALDLVHSQFNLFLIFITYSYMWPCDRLISGLRRIKKLKKRPRLNKRVVEAK